MRLNCLRQLSLAGCLFISLGAVTQATEAEQELEIGTHQQVAVIKMDDADSPMPINAFALDKSGQIIAVCGQGPGEIRVVDDSGKIQSSWPIDVKPEAVHVAPDGTILVGGDGKLFRFAADSKLLESQDSPHAKALREDNESLRQEAIRQLDQTKNPLQSRIRTYESIISTLETKAQSSELNETEEKMMEVLPRMLQQFKDQAEVQRKAKEEAGTAEDEESGPSEEAIAERINALVRSKLKISSISSTDNHVFVATRAIEGYGYDVWKTGSDLQGGEVIVSGLRGCCGQMDVQCCGDELFVAENGSHRVVRYDSDGTEITNWGGRNRTGIEGFSSCCNPMNVWPSSSGDIFTAEASTGRIKQFNTDGEMVAFIGTVDLIPGCKNVSIAVSPDNQRVYMLDLTRNHIVKMELRKESTEADSEKDGEPVATQNRDATETDLTRS